MVSIHPRRLQALRQFVLKLGIDENPVLNWELLDTALTHPTASAERNYERLEFIGDAAIRLASAELLWEIYPQVPVGDYAAIRSVLVSDRVLADIAESYGLDRYLLVANSAAGDKAGYRSRLADGMEAVAAALYLSTHTTELIRPNRWPSAYFAIQPGKIIRQRYKSGLRVAIACFRNTASRKPNENTTAIDDFKQRCGSTTSAWVGERVDRLKRPNKLQPGKPF